MEKEEKTTNAVFKEYEEVVQYIKNNADKLHETENIQIIFLHNCVFEPTIEFNILLQTLTFHWKHLIRIDFDFSVFKGKVKLNGSQQKINKVENGTITDIEYVPKTLKIRLDFHGVHFIKEFNFQSITFAEDIDFIEATFEDKVTFKHLTFNKYFRLSGTTFNSDVNFARSVLNSNTIFFDSNENRTKFKGNVSFWETVLWSAAFWDSTFEKDVDFTNTQFKCNAFFNRTRFSGKLILRSIETMGKTQFEGNLYFDGAIIHDLLLENILFETTLSFNSARIDNIKLNNVLFVRNPLALSGTDIKHIADEYTARILKHEALKDSNNFLALELRAEEMKKHGEELKWFQHFFEKFVFWLNKKSNTYGLNWQKGVLFTMVVWFLFFSVFILIRDGWGDTFIWTNPEYLNEAVNYFWIFNGMQGLSPQTNWCEILPFFLGKIFIAYGIYQTITAFRKHGQNK